MIEIEKARIECEELSQDGAYGRFVIEPLERGFVAEFVDCKRRRKIYVTVLGVQWAIFVCDDRAVAVFEIVGA